MVQIKTTGIALVAAAVIAPAVASSYYYPEDGLVTREDFEEYNDLLARDYDFDLEEREFDDELFEREFNDSEVFEREYDEMDINARGYDEMEIEAREPEAEYEELLQRYFNDLYERAVTAEAEGEIAARGFESEDFDLFRRSPEPNIIDWFKNLFHPKKKQDNKKKQDDKKKTASSTDSKKVDSSDSKSDSSASSDSKKTDSSSSSDSKKTDSSSSSDSSDAAVDARDYYEDFDELD